MHNPGDRTSSQLRKAQPNMGETTPQTRPAAPSSAASRTAASRSGANYASFLVSLGILISRILGLIRDQVFAHYLGNSAAAGAFRAALRIPNFLQNLFGEGVLSASFIPVYARLRASGHDTEAKELAATVATLLALLVSVLVLFGVWLTPSFVEIVAPGFTGPLRELTVQIVRILFPGVGFLVLSAWCLGVLNSHRRFFLSYVAPAFWNLALIATLIYFGRRPGQLENSLVVKLAWGSVVGSLLQFVVQLPFVFQSAGRLPFRLSMSHWRSQKPMHDVFKQLGPVLFGRGVVQLSAYIDGMIASYLGAAAVASLAYAQTIYLLPISLFGMAVAAAELPELSVQSIDNSESRQILLKRISGGLRRIAFFVVPSAVAFVLLGRPMIEVLYQTGRFGSEDSIFVWYILMGSVIGLLAATWGRLYASAFYAMKDTRTPLKFACLRVALTVVLGLLCAFPLRPWIAKLILLIPGLHIPAVGEIELGLGAVGLTASAGVAGWVEFLLLRHAFQKRVAKVSLESGFMLKAWTAALGAGLMVMIADISIRSGWLSLMSSATNTQRRALSLFELALYGGLYLGLASAFGLSEVGDLLTKVITRLGRRKRKSMRHP